MSDDPARRLAQDFLCNGARRLRESYERSPQTQHPAMLQEVRHVRPALHRAAQSVFQASLVRETQLALPHWQGDPGGTDIVVDGRGVPVDKAAGAGELKWLRGGDPIEEQAVWDLVKMAVACWLPIPVVLLVAGASTDRWNQRLPCSEVYCEDSECSVRDLFSRYSENFWRDERKSAGCPGLLPQSIEIRALSPVEIDGTGWELRASLLAASGPDDAVRATDLLP